jgi:hypothetical protein
MPTPPTPPDDRALNRAALERVLARAMELHVRGDIADDARAESVSESRVLEIAREVGITPEAVRQAIAEERAREPLNLSQQESDATLSDPAVSAARLVPGAPGDLLGRAEAMLARDESLGVIRRYPDRLVLEPKRGVLDQMARAMDVGGKGYYLSRASEVVVSVGAVDARRTHVALAADLGRARTSQMSVTAVMVLIGALIGLPAVILTVMPWLAVVPPLLLGYAGWRWARNSWRALRRQVLVSMERLLDRLEYPDKPSPTQQLFDGLARTLLPPH